jgi:hypothetical protein
VGPPPGAAAAVPTVDGVPVLFAGEGFKLTTHGCPGGSATYTLANLNGHSGAAPLATGPLSESAGGVYAATVPPLTVAVPAAAPFSGLARATISFDCGGGATTPPVSFLLYVDPSGTVVDDATGAGIAGATVTLMHADSGDGPFTPVPAGSTMMAPSNRRNPDGTDADGRFGWDVAPGFYRLVASAPGYRCDPAHVPPGMHCDGDAVESRVIAVPPAALDVMLPLHGLAAPPPPAPAPPAGTHPGGPPLISPAHGAAPPVAHRPPRIRRTGHGPIRAQRRATVSVITLELTLDEQATLRLRLLDSHGRSVLLAKGSLLAASRSSRPRRELVARSGAGRIRIAVRVPRTAGPGRLLLVVATDAEGASTRAAFRIVPGNNGSGAGVVTRGGRAWRRGA